MLQRALRTIAVLLLASLLIPRTAWSEGLRVTSPGSTPEDARLGELNHLNGYFPFKVPATREKWEQRAEQLRRRILVANGLWPLPERTPLETVLHGKTVRDGFTVEKVYFQSYPGHFVSGLLFRPAGEGSNRPAVLCPHGHGGRMQNHGDNITKLIASGDEKFEKSGKTPKLARCAQLARMGCVTFIFDMEGYVDSQQIGMAVAHRLRDARPQMESKDAWGFFTAQAELRNQSIMGLQTWNAIRALDFLSSLPDVDSSRIGVTGGSGGGTQTILLGAIDSRPIVSFPNGMVSTAMQGGCTCENCVLLRVDSGNVELAGLFAPRPLAMTGANDWTKEIQTKGYPELQQLYSLYGVKENVFSKELLHFGHNYNYVSRAIMYRWFNRHMKLGFDEPIIEEDWEPLSTEESSVWTGDHKAPEGGEGYERQLLTRMDDLAVASIQKNVFEAKKPFQAFQKIFGGAVDITIGRALPGSGDLEREKVQKIDRGDYLEFGDLVRYKSAGEELPVVSFFPTKTEWNGTVVIWIDGAGKQALYDGDSVRQEVKDLLARGYSVLSADLLHQGEFLADGKPISEQRKVANERQVAAYTYAYNHTLFAQRVHDVLTLIAFVNQDDHGAKDIHLIATGSAGPVAAAARFQSGKVVSKAVIDTGGFRFVDLENWRDPQFLPGVVRYGDLPGLLALNAPEELCILGEGDDIPTLTGDIYKIRGKAESVVTRPGLAEGLKWLE